MFAPFDDALALQPAAACHGLAVGDLDGDGADEILVCGQDGANQVLKWDGAALFDIADGALADPAGQAVTAAFAAIAGGGAEAAYVANRAGPGDRLFARDGGPWQDLLGPAGQASASRAVAALDRTGSGSYGFLTAPAEAPLKLIEPAGATGLTDRAPECGLARQVKAGGLLVAPLTGPGPDVLVSNRDGPNLFFAATADGHFDEQAGPAGLADTLEAGRSLALLDNGGHLDVCATQWEGPHRLWRYLPSQGFVDLAPASLMAPSAAAGVICADFDNDGHQEILVLNCEMPNRLLAWREQAWRPLEPGAAAEGEAPVSGATVGDFDGDGRLELLLARGTSGAAPLALYKAEPPGPANWLRIAPRLPSGAPARGAVVTCWQGKHRQQRVIDGGGNPLGQMEPVAHFGLGAQAAVTRVAVTWPDGATRHLDSPAANDLIRVAHPSIA